MYLIGHIAFSALDDVSHSVHVYNINGTSLGSKYVSGRVTGLTTASDFLVVADDAGDITMSRLNGWVLVYRIFRKYHSNIICKKLTIYLKNVCPNV